jgi:hypothetical protein
MVAGGAAGGALVEGFRPPKIVTVTEYKDRIVEHTVTVEKPVIQYRDRLITRVVTRPDGTKIETHVDDKTSKETGGRTITSNATEERQGESKITQAPEGRWAVRVLAGADTRGSINAGAAVDYRLVGPFTVGAYATAPVAGSPGAFAAGLSVGLRLP